MNTNDFIAKCVLGIPCEKIDKLCDEFDVDFSDDDVEEILDLCSGDCFNNNHYSEVGNMLIERIFKNIIDKHNDVLDEEKFDYYINCDDSHLYYDGERICSQNDLDEIMEKVEAEAMEE